MSVQWEHGVCKIVNLDLDFTLKKNQRSPFVFLNYAGETGNSGVLSTDDS